MLSYLGTNKKTFLLLTFFLILGSFTDVVFAFIVSQAVDVTVNREFEAFQLILLYFLIFTCGNFVIGYLSNLLSAKLNRAIMINFRQNVFTALLSSPFTEYNKTSTGEKMSIFENDLNIIEHDYFDNIVSIIHSAFLLLFSISYLFMIHSILALSIVFGSFTLLIVPILFGKKLNQFNDNLSKQAAIYLTKIKDYFTGIEVIKSNNIEYRVIDEYSNANTNLESAKYSYNKRLALFGQISTNSSYLMVILCFTVGGLLLIRNQISVGQLIASVQLLNNVIQPIASIGGAVLGIKGCGLIIDKVKHILDIPYEKKLLTLTPHKSIETLYVENLYYSYNNEEMVLKNINLELENRKKYAIIGSSGSGKSTLLKLITGFIGSTYQGKISMDDKDIQELSGEELIHYFSYIHQDTFIFNDTVENNITLFKDYSRERVERVLQEVQLNEWIASLPDGMNHNCGENGIHLSGGEKQRIAIARALLRNSPILIMDEGTSALDNSTASKIEEILLSLEDKLIIVVSHKLEPKFLQKFDQIICLNHGTIVEMGNYHTLVANQEVLFGMQHVYC